MHDLAIVGGGPAGLATGIAAARSGLSVVVLDRARPPADKACGEGLMPEGVRALEMLGVRIEPERSAPFVGIRYVDGSWEAEGRFRNGCGLGVRRPALHGALVRAAQQAGVEVSWGVDVDSLRPEGPAAGERLWAARYVVGADGLHSKIRRLVGLDVAGGPPGRYGATRHFECRPWTDLVEVHWSDSGEAYVTPLGPGLVGVACLGPRRWVASADVLSSFPRLAERLSGATPTGRVLGAGPFERRAKDVFAGRVALVGDAAGYADPITGEGVNLALRQAFALVNAIRAGDLATYRRDHRAMVRWPWRLTRLLVFCTRRRRSRRLLMGLLSASPALFSRSLALAGGSPTDALSLRRARRRADDFS